MKRQERKWSELSRERSGGSGLKKWGAKLDKENRVKK